MLQQLQIKQHFKPLTEYLDVGDPVWKAWRQMKSLGVKHLPVLNNKKIVGIISDRDIVQVSNFNGGQSMLVKEAMSLEPLILCLESSMEAALKAMLNKKQQYAIVVDTSGVIHGLFSWSSAFEFFLNFASVENINQLLSKKEKEN